MSEDEIEAIEEHYWRGTGQADSTDDEEPE
jgi:hypothetical protein